MHKRRLHVRGSLSEHTKKKKTKTNRINVGKNTKPTNNRMMSDDKSKC